MKRSALAGTLQLTRVMQEFLRQDENLPVAAALIFLTVGQSLGKDRGPSIQGLASATSLTESRVSRNVTVLEDKDLLRKDRDPDNFRQRNVSLTDRGYAFLALITGHATKT